MEPMHLTARVACFEGWAVNTFESDGILLLVQCSEKKVPRKGRDVKGFSQVLSFVGWWVSRSVGGNFAQLVESGALVWGATAFQVRRVQECTVVV